MRVVDGIDFWENGTPDHKYIVIGVIDDSRGTGPISRMGKDSKIAAIAAAHGGNGVVLVGKESEMRGIDQSGNIYYKRMEKLAVIKYINANGFAAANANLKAKAEGGDSEAQFQLGYLYCTGELGFTNDFTQAIKWYQKAAGQNYPNIQFPLASAYAQRGILKQNNGDLDGALSDFAKAIETKPDFTAVYCRMGLVNYDSHKFRDALTWFRKSCELDVKSKNYSYFLIFVWLTQARLGDQAAATEELKTYLDSYKIQTPDQWPIEIASFLTGQVTESDLFKAAENSDKKKNDGQHCEAFFYAGSKRLIEGDKNTATDYFEKSLSTGCNMLDEYRSAALELEFLKASR